jgi:hypothetical protein
LVGGCVSVQIIDPAGAVRTVNHVGVLHVEVKSAAGVTGSITGVGIVGAPLGWSVGYTRQRWALIDKDCRVVWWAPSGQVDGEIARDLIAAGHACMLPAE